MASQVQVNITLVKKCFYYFKNCIVNADDSNSGPTGRERNAAAIRLRVSFSTQLCQRSFRMGWNRTPPLAVQ